MPGRLTLRCFHCLFIYFCLFDIPVRSKHCYLTDHHSANYFAIIDHIISYTLFYMYL